MRVRELRFLTVVAIVAACGWTIFHGFGFVRYQVSAYLAGDIRNRIEFQAAWADKAGLSSLALEAALRAPADPAELDGVAKRRELLTALLAVHPAASQPWLALAAVRSASGLPAAKVADAFQMSALTGPNEGDPMLQRSLFGVLLWEKISAEVRERVVLDLCGLTVFDPGRIGLVLATKPDGIRAEIRGRLEAGNCPPKTIKFIGL